MKRTKTSLTKSLDKLAMQVCPKENEVTPPDLDSPGTYRCQKCQRVYPWYNPRRGVSGCQWAHIEGRGRKTLRWEPLNCLALCGGPGTQSCHYWFDNNKVASVEWLRQNFPRNYAWLREEVDGKPRSAQLFDATLPDMIEMEQKLKESP